MILGEASRTAAAAATLDDLFRRAGVRRIPYGIFFDLEESRVVVIACLHGRRDPRRWKVRG